MTADYEPVSRARRFVGTCVGGPYAGRRQAAPQPRINVWELPALPPIGAEFLSCIDTIELKCAGFYDFDAALEEWVWHPTT